MTHEPVKFFGDRAVVRLWQHDYGVRLAIAGDYITAGMPCQWHYTGVTGVDSRTITDDNGTLYVAVPDAALAQSDTVTGYIYVHDADSGRTRYTITIEIVARPSTDDTPSADEVTYIGQLVERAEGAKTEAEAAQAAAERARDAAAGSAGEAEASASQAASAVATHAATIANDSELGHVKPASTTPDMTSPVGVDANGRLWTAGKYFERPIYGIKWDKVNAQCARAFDASGITTDTTNFSHNGSVNANYNNPFDALAPWNGRRLCNISLSVYMALVPGAPLIDCVTAWEGNPGFNHSDPDGVWTYTPEFWYRAYNDGGYRYILIGEKEIPGWTHSPARIRGRWFGVQEARVIGGVSKTIILPRAGQPAAGPTMQNIHLYANNAGMTIENIYSLDAELALYLVEFANYNAQEKLGNGVSDLYRQSGYLIKSAATNSNVIQIDVADASAYVIPGATIDIGTSDGGAQVGRFMVVSAVVNGVDGTLLDVTLGAPVTVTTAHFWSIHGKTNIENSAIGSKSGYIGTNGKSEAYYRGGMIHANRYRYVLGAYRQQNTGHIWVAPNEAAADAVNELNTGIHIDTGLILPQAADGAAYSGYTKTLGEYPGLAAAPFCIEGGGSSANPVGDYVSAPALATANTALLLGGNARSGANAGPWFGYWNFTAGDGIWYISAVPLLKTP
jgi:hypothetical protein